MNKKLTNIRSRYQAEKVAIQKDHKSYVKPLKKTIGKLTSKNIKLSKVKDVTENVAKLKKAVKVDIFNDATDVSDFDLSAVICSLCGVDIPDYKPKFFLGEEINPACAKHADEFLSSDDGSVTNCEKFDNRMNIDLGSDQCLRELTNYGICNHSLQCILRQPLPPPFSIITHLKNDRTKYNKYMMENGGAPGRYGGHEHCLNAYSKNYGCEDCIWLKWNGELYGFSDIIPHDFKKHLDPT